MVGHIKNNNNHSCQDENTLNSTLSRKHWRLPVPICFHVFFHLGEWQTKIFQQTVSCRLLAASMRCIYLPSLTQDTLKLETIRWKWGSERGCDKELLSVQQVNRLQSTQNTHHNLHHFQESEQILMHIPPWELLPVSLPPFIKPSSTFCLCLELSNALRLDILVHLCALCPYVTSGWESTATSKLSDPSVLYASEPFSTFNQCQQVLLTAKRWRQTHVCVLLETCKKKESWQSERNGSKCGFISQTEMTTVLAVSLLINQARSECVCLFTFLDNCASDLLQTWQMYWWGTIEVACWISVCFHEQFLRNIKRETLNDSMVIKLGCIQSLGLQRLSSILASFITTIMHHTGGWSENKNHKESFKVWGYFWHRSNKAVFYKPCEFKWFITLVATPAMHERISEIFVKLQLQTDCPVSFCPQTNMIEAVESIDIQKVFCS